MEYDSGLGVDVRPCLGRVLEVLGHVAVCAVPTLKLCRRPLVRKVGPGDNLKDFYFRHNPIERLKVFVPGKGGEQRRLAEKAGVRSPDILRYPPIFQARSLDLPRTSSLETSISALRTEQPTASARKLVDASPTPGLDSLCRNVHRSPWNSISVACEMLLMEKCIEDRIWGNCWRGSLCRTQVSPCENA